MFTFFIIITFFIFGLLIGSFCNVLIFRIRKAMSFIRPNSHCFLCKKKVAWRDNIPLVSFLILKGECRNCKVKISWQYPLVEFSIGILWGLIGYLYTSNFINDLYVAVSWGLIFSALAVVFIYDWKYMEIPMGLIWFSLVLVLVINFSADGFSLVNFFDSVLFKNGLSGLAVFLFFFGLSFVSEEQWMGYGDSFLAFLVGFALGGTASFLAILIAFCVGAIFSIFLIVLDKARLKSQVPFGPFLIFGFAFVFFVQFFCPSLIRLFG